jgi:hypothetical protein
MIILPSNSLANLEGSKLTANFETCLPDAALEQSRICNNSTKIFICNIINIVNVRRVRSEGGSRIATASRASGESSKSNFSNSCEHIVASVI